MAQWAVSFWLHDESAMSWAGQATDEADAVAKGVEYFEDLGDGPLAGLTNAGVRDPETIPEEGTFVYQATQQTGQMQAR
jgi:hypothetical protein